MVERTTQGTPARTGAPRHRARKGLGAILSIAVTTAAAAAAAVVAPIVVAAAPASAAAPEQCVASPVWGGIATLTGRDTNTSLYAGGDLTISGPASETEGLTVVGGSLDTTGTDRSFLFGNVGMGFGQWPYPDADMLAVGGDTRTNPASTAPFVTGNGRVGGTATGPAVGSSLAQVPNTAVTYGLGASAIGAVSPGNGGSPVDYSAFGSRVTALSGTLAATPTTGTTTIAAADPTDITVTAYSRDVSTLHLADEGMVTFTGDGTSALQVFTLDGNVLTAFAAGKSGISFDYEGIPAGASVVVNVTGGDIAFAQGWRTIFNGVDVHDPFTNPTGFATAASAVLFNYSQATSVAISGGNATETARVDQNGGTLTPSGAVTDDSVAQSIGSIISPAADLTIGVVTNGRLFTGGDIALAQENTSIAGDLEHHNFAWNGNRVTACLGAGSVSWTKTDAQTAATIAGSTWQLTGPNGLDLTVADNGASDADAASGALTVDGLEEGDYTLTETAAPTGYSVDATPHTFSVTADAMSVQLGAIANARVAGSVTWTKVDGATSAVLAGSSWQLTGPDGLDETIADNGTLDTDQTDGVLTVGALAWGDYTLTETVAPTGYTLDPTPHAFSVTAATTAVNLGAIANTEAAGSVTWTKVDSATSDVLAGSAWQLTGPDGLNVTVADNGALDTDAAEGALTVGDLAWGDYTLTETVAPTGYTLDPTPHTFSVAADTTAVDIGAIANTRAPVVVTTKGGGSDGGVTSVTGSGDDVLAHTGSTLGFAAAVAACAALALLIAGATLLLLRRRRVTNG